MKTKTQLITGLSLLLVAALAGFWLLKDASSPETATSDANPARAEVRFERVEDLKSLSPEEAAKMQHQAAAAASQAVDMEPLKEPVSERPDYVSPIEWTILQTVAEQSENPQAHLTRLVNKLRFSKQVELWENDETLNPQQKSALARQILNDIPGQVADNSLASENAQQLQTRILATLYSDPEKRQARAAEEAERIGVTFSLQASNPD